MQISDKSIQKTLGTMLGLLSLHDLILHTGLAFSLFAMIGLEVKIWDTIRKCYANHYCR